jgi:uncharacterized protein (TIGR03435 family)
MNWNGLFLAIAVPNVCAVAASSLERNLMIRAMLSLAVCAAGVVCAQAAVQQQFEVASVKPSKADPRSSSGIRTGHGRIDAGNVTLQRCIMGAYGAGPHQIVGGPDWLTSSAFEISAKAETPDSGDAELMVMLQALLADRFKLVLHRESRVMPAFVLEVDKNGPKLEKATAPGESETNTSGSNAGVVISARYIDMDAFARVLARKTELPVVNQTGLAGSFHLKLSWTPESARPAENGVPEGVSLFTAIQEQLGLRLRKQRTAVEVLVVDRAEKPSEN